MFLKKILLCAVIAAIFAPVCAFAKGPHFSFSLNMFAPMMRPCIVRPCPPPPPVIVYPYYVHPYYYPCWIPAGHIGYSLGR